VTVEQSSLKPTLGGAGQAEPPDAAAPATVADMMAWIQATPNPYKTMLDQAAAMLVAEQARSRGAAGGAKVCKGRALANDHVMYDIVFRGGDLAMVQVVGDRGTDLDLYIYDDSDKLIASDTTGTDNLAAVWMPAKTASYRIKIVNLGKVYNRYNLVTN